MAVVRIAFQPFDASGVEATAIAEWLGRQRDLLLVDDVAAADVVWLHACALDPPALTTPPARPLLLTGSAVLLPSAWGWEQITPNERRDSTWSDEQDDLFLHADFTETPRIRGHAALAGGPLF